MPISQNQVAPVNLNAVRKHTKPHYNIRNVEIVPAELLWPDNERCKGKFVLKGTSDQYESGYPVRTSLIVKADIEAGTFETLNSIYKVVV
jgi:hypothetical protein